MILLILTKTVTKRSQLPFSRRLPAVVTAPTSVSLLAHFSTFAAAVIYNTIKYNCIEKPERNFLYNNICTVVGPREQINKANKLRPKKQPAIIPVKRSTVRAIIVPLIASVCTGSRQVSANGPATNPVSRAIKHDHGRR